MKEADRIIRDARIRKLHGDGVAPADIARDVGLNTERVRTILVDAGLMQRGEQRGRDDFWDEDNAHRLRMAIYERQRKGVRQTIQLMEGRST